MSSLTHCLKANGFSKAETKIIKSAAAEYTKEGFDAQAANEGAVKDLIKSLRQEHADVMKQVEAQLGVVQGKTKTKEATDGIDHTRVKAQDTIKFNRGGRDYTEMVLKVMPAGDGPLAGTYQVDSFGIKYIKPEEVKAVSHRDGTKQYTQEATDGEERQGREEALLEEGKGEAVANAAPEKLQDFGEKIGGARKDIAKKGVKSSTTKTKEETGWRARYKALENSVNPGEWMIADTKSTSRWGNVIRQKFYSKEEAEKAIPLIAVARQHSVLTSDTTDGKFAIFKNVTDRKRIKVVGQEFDSREEAMKYMAIHAEEILDLKTNFGEEILPVPEIAVRKGPDRRQGPATPEMFMETFAPRGIEFGNWNNQEERQQVLDHAYDGLMDLAEVLKVEPKALMLNGELAIAFGARGQGLSGAKAHYEPSYGVINLTKMSGAGSLAHEWFHALDHYLARQDTKAKNERVLNKRGDMVFPDQGIQYQMQSHGESIRNPGVRPELQAAYSDLIDTMYKKAEQYVEDTKVAEKFIGAIKQHLRDQLDRIRRDIAADNKRYAKKFGGWRKSDKGLHPASAEQLAEFDRLADSLVEGGNLELREEYVYGKNDNRGRPTPGYLYSTNGTLDAINEIYKAVRGRSGFTKDGGFLSEMAATLRNYSQRLKMFEDAKNSTEKTKRVPTRFAIEARKMDQARRGDYWSEPHEMAARAFAAYVEDKVAESGGQSDFLVYHAHGGILLPMIDGFVARPYPEGDERVTLKKAFDNFVGEVKTKPTDKGVALYAQTPNLTGSTVAIGKQEIAGQYNQARVKIVQSVDELPDGAKFMTAWHGGPHDFDKFSSEKIGTGEGAQAYGYGLYFAGAKEVAEHYRKALSGKTPAGWSDKYPESARGYIRGVVGDVARGEATPKQAVGWIQNANINMREYSKEQLEKEIEEAAQIVKGRLLQVELAPAEEEYLLWDRPLSEQSEKVRGA